MRLDSAGLVRALPRRAVSRLVGAVVRIPLPAPVVGALGRAWARAYGSDLAETPPPPGGWRSFLDFFVRGLAPGARPLDPDPRAVVSPADGRVHATGRVEAGSALQAKGLSYRLAELLGSDEEARRFEGGTFLTAYLAPGDYHRFHWPFDARVERVRHLPGDLWPVHPGAAASIPRLLCRNERVAVLGSLPSGGAFAFVPVGALNVGSIRLAFRPLGTNRGGRVRTWDVSAPVRRGEEAGRFEMGSAIVLLLAREAGALDPLAPGTRLRVGVRVGARG